MRSARELALLCGFLKNDEWVLTLSWGSKRIDTKVSILLGLQFPLFLSLAQTRDRRPLRKGERQSGYRCVYFATYSQFTDSVLLHMRFTLRRRDIFVSRNSLAWWLRTALANISLCIRFTLHLFTLHSSLFEKLLPPHSYLLPCRHSPILTLAYSVNCCYHIRM